MPTRYAFAGAFVGCFVVTDLVYSQLDPAAQAQLVAWASTNVANLEHEPVLPLLVSAFVAPGYFIVWLVLIALAPGASRTGQQRGGLLARVLAAVDLLILVFPGGIFDGLSQLGVPAVGHLTAMLTAAAATAAITARRRGPSRRGSAGYVADGHADQVGNPGREGAQDQLADGAPPERPVG